MNPTNEKHPIEICNAMRPRRPRETIYSSNLHAGRDMALEVVQTVQILSKQLAKKLED
jgi:hypothetical protein